MADDTEEGFNSPELHHMLKIRLSELGYFESSIDDRWDPEIEQALLRYAEAEGLPHDEPNLEILLSLFPNADWNLGPLRPLSPTEMQRAMQHMEAITNATDERSYRAAFAETFMDMGLRFMVPAMEVLEHGDEQQKQGVLESEGILMDWLFGERMTDRADEHERRVLVARQILDLGDEFKPMWRAAAHSMSQLPDEHPLRDIDEIRRILEACLQDAMTQQDAEREIYTRCDLVELDLSDEERCEQNLTRCFELLEEASDDDSSLRSRVSNIRFSYLMEHFLAAAEAGDDERRDRFTLRAEAALADIRDSASDDELKMPLIALATSYSWTDPRRSAELFAESRGKVEKGSWEYHKLGAYEGMQWLRCDEPARALDTILPAISLLETDYMGAVSAAEIEANGKILRDATVSLAISLAQLDRWTEAFEYAEQSKSLRLRYRSALQASSARERLQALEGEMYELRLGRVSDSRVNSLLDSVVNPVSSELSRYSSLLEEYRQLLAGISHAELQRASLQQVAASLRPDEALLSVVAGQQQSLVVLVTASDVDTPAVGALLHDWTLSTDARVNDGVFSGWLYSLAILDPSFDRSPALDGFIDKFDAVLAPLVRAAIEERGIRRLVVVPHDFMRLAPFWALPCLRDLQVTLEISAATFLEQRTSETARIASAAAVCDPLLDLPAASGDASAAVDALSCCGVPVSRMSGQEANRSSLHEALKTADWFHYSGHGHTPLVDPLEASLLLNPAWDSSAPGSSDVFWSIAAEDAADDPAITADGMTRVQIDGVGILEDLGDASYRERLLHCNDGRRLWAVEDEGKRGRVADRYSAAQLLGDAAERMPRVANLAACSVGASGFNSVEEWQGVAATLHLVGVTSIIAALWPVTDVAAAIFVQLFYRELHDCPANKEDDSIDVDLCALLNQASNKMRKLSRDEGADLLQSAAERERADAPREALLLELTAERLRDADEHPFQSAYHHAAFYLLGQSRITLPGRTK